MKSFKQHNSEGPKGPSEKHFMHHAKKLLQHFDGANVAEYHRDRAFEKSYDSTDPAAQRGQKYSDKIEHHEKQSGMHSKEIEKHYGHEVLGDIHDTDYGHGNRDRKNLHSQLKGIYAGLSKTTVKESAEPLSRYNKNIHVKLNYEHPDNNWPKDKDIRPKGPEPKSSYVAAHDFMKDMTKKHPSVQKHLQKAWGGGRHGSDEFFITPKTKASRQPLIDHLKKHHSDRVTVIDK